MKFIDILKKSEKLYFTIADLLALGNYAEDSLYVTLSRLVQRNELIRLTHGIYIVPDRYGEIERIANCCYFPSYLSFDTALAKYGVISQIPYTLMFATPLKTKKLQLGNYQIEYRKLKDELFFGYNVDKNGLLIATPEKALFDLYYISSFGKMTFEFENTDTRRIDMDSVISMVQKYRKKGRYNQ